MSLDQDLSELKDYLLHAKKHNLLSGVKRDSMEFILWELKFVDMFLRLQSFTFACECGMLDFAQRMHEIWKMSEDSDSNADGQTEIWKTKLEFRAKYSFPSIPFSANKVDDTSPTPLFVMEFIDTVVENLMNVVKSDDPSSLRFAPGSKEQIKDFIMELMLLRLFVCFISNKCIEPQNQHTFFTHVLIEVGDTAMVTWLYFPIDGNEDKDLSPSGMNVLFSDLIQMKIKHIQPGIRKIYVDVLQDLKSTIQPGWHPNIIQNKHTADRGYVEVLTHNLVELPMVSNPTRVVSLNDQMETLQEMLALLRDNLIHLPVQDLELHEMDTVIIDAGLLFYSLYGSNREKVDMALEDVNQALGLDLPSNIQPIKVTICLIVRKVFQSNLPRIHGLGYVDFLLNNLKEFQDRYANSLTSVKSLLQIIEKKLESLQPSLKALAEESQNKLKNLQDCATRLISKAYEVEYVVAACINKGVPDWCIEHWLQDLIEEITHIKAEVAEITEKQLIVVDLVSHNTLESSTVHTSSQLAKNQSMTEGIVGFEDVMEELRRRLIKEPRDLDVISLVGMPGLGKTTLAYKLYSDQSVISHFDIRAQCCVSQAYKRADLLMAILHDAIGVRPSASDEAGVADELRKTLMAKRYLVLIDDVWGANAWDDLRSCFYDARNGSRIILTTRHFEVANYATSSYISKPIHLRMFDEDESWKLLEDRVFGKGSCSPALEEVGQQIAKRCGGLPLSIVLVAGILAKVEKTEESWKQVAMTLGSHIHKDSKAIVEQSYQDLPFHLRPCFLYFGAFSEDSVFDASMLTRLWISEAFIKSCEGKSLEEISKGYLENLIGRNLVMVSKRTYLDGNVKSCRIHDVLFDFCKERATKENFLLWIKQDQSVNLSSYIYSHKQHAQRRLAFCEVDNLEEWSSSCSLVGSVLSTKDTEFFGPLGVSSLALAISGILRNFKFLKVLILDHNVIIDFFPTELVYLRYFSAKIVKKSITSSISNLWNLETLILKRRQGGLRLPSSVWNMVKLKHLHISDFRIEDAKRLPENSTILNNLKTLSAPYFSCVKDAELMFRRTPNLQKLICEFRGDYRFEYHVLNFPTQLETLKISRSEYTSSHIPFCISAPNIKSLKLSGFYLDHRHFSVVAQLQNLQVLKLLLVSFPDSEWNVSNGEFPQLKVLKLHSLHYLKEWTVADDAFPILERLVLHGCWNLKEIPSCFEDVSFLKYIEVEKCSESVVKSARDIRETQVEEYQNIDFKLMIIKDYDTSSDEDESSEATNDVDESSEASSDGDKSYEASSDGDESSEKNDDS